MNNSKRPKRQVETAASALVEPRFAYADLLHLEWVLEDWIDEWEWRDKGLDELIGKGRAILGRIREMIRLDEEGGES